MRPSIARRIHITVAMVLAISFGSGAAEAKSVKARFRGEFLKLCDVACKELTSETRRAPFYQDSYAIRALAVAYDVTGKKKYLAACRQWSDRMLAFQEKMTPRGAYYMNYGRKPGELRGGWYVADSASVAMGVLATAVRTSDPAEKQRYMDSVTSFARLVLDNYVRPSGGITDGLWEKWDGEWWCSSGIFGSLMFLLYEETGNKRYLDCGLGALDWLIRTDFRNVEHYSLDELGPAVVMYVFEAYSAGLPYVERGSQRRKGAESQIALALDWMADNQEGRGGRWRWDYNRQWGSKMGGMPFHMLVYARHLPGGDKIAQGAEQELAHLSKLLFDGKPLRLSQLAAFSMMSYAEDLAPGAIYRSSKAKPERRGLCRALTRIFHADKE